MRNKDLTISQLFEKVFKEHWDTDRFKRSGWAVEARRLYDRLIGPTLGEKLQGTLKASQIRAWHSALAATPLQANRALGVLSKMLSYAEEREWRPQGTNVCKLVKPYKEPKRKRFASPEEIQKLGAVLNKEAVKNPRAVAFIYTLLFSGARSRSLERSTWNDLTVINHENQTFGVLTFNGKSTYATGETEQVIIPPQAMALLDPTRVILCNPEYNPTHQTFLNETLFGIKLPKDIWRRVRKEAGCESLQARDLRRTFATVGLSNGVSQGIIGELLNHRNPETTAIYAKLLNHKRIEATKAIADHVTKLLKGGK